MKLFGLTVSRTSEVRTIEPTINDVESAEKRGIENPATPMNGAQLLAAIGGGYGDGPVNVTPSNAIQLGAVYSCVRLIAQMLACMPFRAYERTKDGRKAVDNMPIAELLQVSPNGRISSFTWVEGILWNLLLWGNHYSEIQINGAGQVVALWPLLPWNMKHKTAPNGERFYFYTNPDGSVTTLREWQVLHVEGPGGGLSPIGVMRRAIALGMAAEDFGSKFFQNGARLSGVLTTDQKLSPEAATRLRNDFTQLHSGLSNSHRIAVLEQGLEWNQTSANPEDAQFLETRKFQRSEIAGLFQVPPHLIGDLERATFSNIEHQGIGFVMFCLMPWATRIEAECNRKLFADPLRYFVKFSLNGLMRGDTKSRFEAYAIARQNGWLSVNEIRAFEELNPVEGGDQYLQPLNMTPIGAKSTEPKEPTQDDAGKPGDEGSADDASKA